MDVKHYRTKHQHDKAFIALLKHNYLLTLMRFVCHGFSLNHWKPALFFQSGNSIITKGLDQVDSTHNGIISMITFFRSDGNKPFYNLDGP